MQNIPQKQELDSNEIPQRPKRKAFKSPKKRRNKKCIQNPPVIKSPKRLNKANGKTVASNSESNLKPKLSPVSGPSKRSMPHHFSTKRKSKVSLKKPMKLKSETTTISHRSTIHKSGSKLPTKKRRSQHYLTSKIKIRKSLQYNRSDGNSGSDLIGHLKQYLLKRQLEVDRALDSAKSFERKNSSKQEVLATSDMIFSKLKSQNSPISSNSSSSREKCIPNSQYDNKKSPDQYTEEKHTARECSKDSIDTNELIRIQISDDSECFSDREISGSSFEDAQLVHFSPGAPHQQITFELEDVTEEVNLISSTEIFSYLDIISFVYKQKGIDVSRDFMLRCSKFLEEIADINLFDRIEVNPLEKLAVIQGSKVEEGNAELSESYLIALLKEMNPGNLNILSIYLKLIFDCINEAMNKIKDQTEAMYFKEKLKHAPQYSLKSGFKLINQMLLSWENVKAGRPDLFISTIRLIANLDILEGIKNSTNFDREETLIAFELGDIIFKQLRDEMFDILSQD